MLTLLGSILLVCVIYVVATARNDKLTVDARSMAYTALRKLVDRTVDEVCKPENVRDLESSETRGGRFGASGEAGAAGAAGAAEKAYDNLLASLVINKIIEKYRLERVDVSRSGGSAASPSDAANAATFDGRLGDDGVGIPSENERCPKCSQPVSALVPTLPSKSLALAIEERIEEVTSCTAEARVARQGHGADAPSLYKCHRVPFPELGMDVVDLCENSLEADGNEDERSGQAALVSSVESWKENWLFQKKNAARYSSPVAMFVPNSSAEYRAMIGDKDAEDISDLSECSVHSDEELEDESKANQVPFSKLAAARRGSGEPPHSASPKPTVSQTGLSTEGSVAGLDEDAEDDRSPSTDSPLPCARPNGTSEPRVRETAEDSDSQLNDKSDNGSLSAFPAGDAALFAPPLPGSIAEREHKKWENALPILNNPYSKENIEKRLAEKEYRAKYSTATGTTNSQCFSRRKQGTDFETRLRKTDDTMTEAASNNLTPERIICNVKEEPAESRSTHNFSKDDDEISKSHLSIKIDVGAEVESHESKCHSDLVAGRQFESSDSLEKSNDAENALFQTTPPKSLQNFSTDNPIINSTLQKSKLRNNLPRTTEESDENVNKRTESLLNNPCNINVNDVIMLPSVKKIVQDFNKKEHDKNTSSFMIASRIGEVKVQNKPFRIRQTQTTQLPKHLHSLTARSLSKEFREGLRQTPKETDVSSSANQRKIFYNEKNQSDRYKCNSDELKCQEHEKLKNNIEFWEKQQRRK